MTDDLDTKTDTAVKPARKSLSLQRTEKGAVKQSFSHGRSKTVVVETKRRRMLGKKDEDQPAPEIKSAPIPAAPPRPKAVETSAPAAAAKPAVLRTLSDEEKNLRSAALVQARKDEDVRRKRDEIERVEREAREAVERASLEESRRAVAEDEGRRTRETEARRREEERAREALEEEEREKKRRAAVKEARGKGKDEPSAPADPFDADKDNPLAKLGGRLKTKRKPLVDKGEREETAKEQPRRRAGKLTISNALD
ncbi:MAG: IF-2-associated domain-containing protein, partial [Parvularculaceae bacterium]